MGQTLVFPFSEYWSFYLVFSLAVVGLLALDLGVFHRKAHAVGFREAALWSAFWVLLAFLFNYLLFLYTRSEMTRDGLGAVEAQATAKRIALEFLAGFIVEKSLAVDNLFVFVLIFQVLSIPATYHHRVLFYGILGALVFRAIFITIGAILMQYELIVILFGIFLILTGLKFALAPQQGVDPEKNPVIRLFRRFMPVTSDIRGGKFFVRESGRLYATPLFIALLFVEVSDIIFAVDSVPAIFALTREPLIVFTSNVFAILGLRSLYFLLAGMVDRFHALRYGLAVVLVFVGLKMAWLNEAMGGKFPIVWSLIFITVVLALSIIISLLRPAHAAKSEDRA